MYFGISVTLFSASINFKWDVKSSQSDLTPNLRKIWSCPFWTSASLVFPETNILCYQTSFISGFFVCLSVFLAALQFLSHCFLRKKHVNIKISTQVPDELLENCASLLSPTVGVWVFLKYHTNQMIAGNWSDVWESCSILKLSITLQQCSAMSWHWLGDILNLFIFHELIWLVAF